jgi:methionyl-tRNA formyltransferase
MQPVTPKGNNLQIWTTPSRIDCVREVLELPDWAVQQIVVLSEKEKHEFTEQNLSVPVEVAPRGGELEVWKKRPGDLLLSVGWHRIFKPDFIREASPIVNIHPSLLPKYRGWALNWALVNGDTEHGLTAHIVDEGVDTGPILLQRRISLSKFDTYRSLLRKLIEAHLGFLPEVLQKLKSAELVSVPQDENTASAPSRRTPKDSEIDPSKPLLELYDIIRASDPDAFPAHFFIEGQKVCIKLWRSEKPNGEEDMI